MAFVDELGTKIELESSLEAPHFKCGEDVTNKQKILLPMRDPINASFPQSEVIGRHYLKTKLHLTQDRSLKNKFFCLWDYPTIEKPNEIWEIKSKQLPDYRPYAIDFRTEQVACVQKYPDKTWKALVIFYNQETKNLFIKLFDIRKDFLNINRNIDESSGTIRLSLKYNKRDYPNHL